MSALKTKAAENPARGATGKADPNGAGEFMSKKILLADDSITIQKVVELTFSEGDYQVFSVGNGRTRNARRLTLPLPSSLMWPVSMVICPVDRL